VIRLWSFRCSKRRNPNSKVAEVPEQREFTFSGSLVTAGYLKQKQNETRPLFIYIDWRRHTLGPHPLVPTIFRLPQTVRRRTLEYLPHRHPVGWKRCSVRQSDSTLEFPIIKRRNSESKLAQVPEQSESTYSGSLVIAGYLKQKQNETRPLVYLCIRLAAIRSPPPPSRTSNSPTSTINMKT